jgi:hypothetical protein
LVKQAESELSLALESEARGDWRKALQKRRYSQAALAELSERVTGLLEDSWRAVSVSRTGPAWRDEGKFFLVTRTAAFLQHVFAHLQNLFQVITMGLVLMPLAANYYRFQPHDPLLLFGWGAVLASVGLTLFILVSASRDKTLSLLTGTAPGKVNITRDLVLRVLFNVVFPVTMMLGI